MVENTSRRVPVDTSEAHWPHLFEPFRNMAASVANYFSPSADAASGMEDYEINMELPGVSADDIDVSLNDHVLTVKGEKKSSREDKDQDILFLGTQLWRFPTLLPPARGREYRPDRSSVR